MVDVKKEKFSQNILLTNRETLEITGIDEVNSFDEKQITAYTSLGFVTVKGSSLKIKNFNNKTKELSIDGKIDAVSYSERFKNKNLNLWNRLFK